MFNIRNHYKLLVKKYSLIHVTWKFKLRISYGLPGSAWHCSQLCVRTYVFMKSAYRYLMGYPALRILTVSTIPQYLSCSTTRGISNCPAA